MATVLILNSEPYRSLFIEWFEEQLKEVFAKGEDQDAMLMAAVEALNNAAEHGNLNNPSKRIKIDCFLQKELVLLAVADEGPGYTPLEEDQRKRLSGGRGLGLIRANTDLVFFNDTANQIIMFKGASICSETGVLGGLNLAIINETILFVSHGQRAAARDDFSPESNWIWVRLGALKPRGIFLDLGRGDQAHGEAMTKIVETLLTMGQGKLYVFNSKAERGVRTRWPDLGLAREQVQVLRDFGQLAKEIVELLDQPAAVQPRPPG